MADFITRKRIRDEYWLGADVELVELGLAEQFGRESGGKTRYKFTEEMPEPFELAQKVNHERYTRSVDRLWSFVMGGLERLRALYKIYLDNFKGDDSVAEEATSFVEVLDDVIDELLGTVAIDELPDDFMTCPVFIPPAALPCSAKHRHHEDCPGAEESVAEMTNVLEFIRNTLAQHAQSEYFCASDNEPIIVETLGTLEQVIDMLANTEQEIPSIPDSIIRSKE